MPVTNIFGYDREVKKPRILATHDPILFNVREFPPVSGLPAGKVRIRLRADEIAPVVFVRNADGIRKFLIHIDDNNHLSRGPEVAANWRSVSHEPPALELDSEEAAAAEAQRGANHTGTKWVWGALDGGGWIAKPADVLHAVILNDVELAGEIVVLRRPSRKEVYRLAWPELPHAPGPAKVPS